jgi:hypothetical protein
MRLWMFGLGVAGGDRHQRGLVGTDGMRDEGTWGAHLDPSLETSPRDLVEKPNCSSRRTSSPPSTAPFLIYGSGVSPYFPFLLY